MVSISNAYGVTDYNAASPVFGQQQVVSQPMFRAGSLAQPAQDGFVATQPKEESFYQKHKGLVWGLGIVAAAGLALFAHKSFKLNESVAQSAKNKTEIIENLSHSKVKEDVTTLRSSHPNQAFTLYDLRHQDSKKVLDGFAEHELGHSKDATHAIVSYAESDKPDKAVKRLLKLYKSGEVDGSITELLKEKGYSVIK